MKQKLLIALLLALSLTSFSQESKFSIELNYPIPADNNFVGQNYNGIIDLGFKYRFVELGVVNIGASLNGGIIKNSKKDAVQPFDVTAYNIQPRIFVELDDDLLSKLHPSIGLGYSFMVFKASGITTYNPENPAIQTSSTSEIQGGINLNLAASYDVTQKFFAII